MASLSDRMLNIHFNTLPKTFQDAVQILRVLGMRYLWIDSLCIIQDDYEDWKREASLMGDIYENASIVIAASAATSSEGGLFQKYTIIDTVALPLFDENGDAKGSILARTCPPDEDCLPSKSTLNTRGWTTQETLLARRILFYTRQRLVWNCRSMAKFEYHDDGRFFSSFIHESHAWSRVVTSYTERQFTLPSDRLVALDGIASRFQRGRHGQYWVGCWTDLLPGNLLWSRVRETLERPGTFGHIPSWSWASTLGTAWYWEYFQGGPSGEQHSCVTFDLNIPQGIIVLEGQFELVELRHMNDDMQTPEFLQRIGLSDNGDVRSTPEKIMTLLSSYNFDVIFEREEGSAIGVATLDCTPKHSGTITKCFCLPLVWCH